jgi:carboxypeptidase-like protein/TonB-dependent receptor-like protein
MRLPGALALVAMMVVSSPAVAAQASAPAGTGRIQGTVVDARTGTPLPGVVVGIQQTPIKTVTDSAGAFALVSVPAGRQPLLVTLVGYGLARPLVTVPPNGTVSITIPLSDGTSTYTERVTVQADPFRSPGSVVPGEQSLTSGDLMNLRGVLTDDPFRAVQALPGVATGNDFRSDFSIRGSDSRHLSLTVDGVQTRWPLHIVRDHEDSGSIALINGDILDHVTVASGVYPVQQQVGRTGAWVDFSIREGSRDARIVHGAVGTTSASFVTEGPIGQTHRGSWLASIRQSYVQWLIKKLDDSGSTAFGFMDAQAKIVYDVTPRQQLQLTAIAGRSRLDDSAEEPDSNSITVGRTRAGLLLAGWRSTIGSTLVVTQRVALAGTSFHNDGTLGPILADGSSSSSSYRSLVAWAPKAAWLAQVGVLVQRDRDSSVFRRFFDTPTGFENGEQVEVVDAAEWTTSGDARLVWKGPGAQAIDAGVLVEHSSLTGSTGASPWLIAAQPIGSRVTLRGGLGLRQQFPLAEQVVGSFGRPDVTAERARSADIGVEYRPSATLRAEVVFYDREERDRLRLEDKDTRLVDGQLIFPSLTPVWRNALRGLSRGVELVLQRRAGRGLSGWVSYAYGRTRYTDTVHDETFWADTDQRHTFNAYGQYRISSRTSFGAKLRIGSNVPLPGYFEQRGDVLVMGALRNTLRLPTYSRLDIRANHAFNYEKRRLTLFVELINVLNRTNWGAAGDVFVRNGQVLGYLDKLFPFLPSAGILIDF